jgi:hypothetical protein
MNFCWLVFRFVHSGVLGAGQVHLYLAFICLRGGGRGVNCLLILGISWKWSSKSAIQAGT